MYDGYSMPKYRPVNYVHMKHHQKKLQETVLITVKASR